MWLFLLYAAFFCGLSIVDSLHARTFRAFSVNDNRSGTTQVSFSLIASCVGGSATIGMCGLAWSAGLPGIWWLASGALGLAFLTLTLSRRIARSGALTMPDMVRQHLGDWAITATVIIIGIAWISILSAQFAAMGRVVAELTGWGPRAALLAGAGFITFYTMLGGQASVMRSDVVQLVILFTGLTLVLAWVVVRADPGVWGTQSWALLNDAFPLSRWTYFMLLMGGSYVVCPMLFSRFLSARNERIAFRGGFIAVAGLLLISLVIVLIGMGAHGILPATTHEEDVLMQVAGRTPLALNLAFSLAMMSAIVSSADSCIITVATVLSHDFLKSSRVFTSRLCILFVALLAIGNCLLDRSILGYLLMANNIYVCGVVAPVYIAFFFRRRLRTFPALLAICGGGFLGLLSELTAQPLLSYAAITLSTVFGALAAATGRTLPDAPAAQPPARWNHEPAV